MTSIPLHVRYVQLKPIHGTPVVASMAKLHIWHSDDTGSPCTEKYLPLGE